MKQLGLLFITVLCLGCLLPIMSYQLQHSTEANANYSSPHETKTPAPQGITPTSSTLQEPWFTQDSAASNPIDDGNSSPNIALDTLPNGTATPHTPNPSPDRTNDSISSTASIAPSNTPVATLTPFLIWDEGSSTALTVSVRAFLIGAVASEMAMTWPDEALKAQAVACHSYLLYCKDHADPNLHEGAYLSADPARRQGFMTDDVLRSYWGTAYDENHTRLATLIDEVLDVVVTHQGKAAATSYYAISNGMTETSEAVWGQALPYLVSVESETDKAAKGYYASVSYTKAQVAQILESVFWLKPQSTAPSDYFGQITFDEAGYVTDINLCGQATAGTLVRTAFALRSNCFWVVYSAEEETFTFTTAGYGHGVGLSQWGAKFRAEAGADYTDILAHYFPETTLSSAQDFEG